MFPYSSLVVYTLVSVTTSFLVTRFRVSIWILSGLNTYIHPENVGTKDGGNVKAVLRRPGETDEASSELDNYVHLDGAKNKGKTKDRSKVDPSKGLRKKKAKEKSEFDETNAQIFRVRLVDSQLQSREYFGEYDEAVIYASLGLCNLLTYLFLPECLNSDGKKVGNVFFKGDLVPILVGKFAIYKLARFLGRVSLESYTTKNSERIMSVFVGVLGFLVSLTILCVSALGFVDLQVGAIDSVELKDKGEDPVSYQFGFVKFLLAIFAGWLSGLLFVPARKAVQSFWLGTDQLQWNMAVIGSGKVTRILFYLSIAMPVFTSILWIKPMADIFVSENTGKQISSSMKSRMSSSDKEPRVLQHGTPYSNMWTGQNFEVDDTVPQDPAYQNKVSECSEGKEDLKISGLISSKCEHTNYQRQKSEGTFKKSQDLMSGLSDSAVVYDEGEDTKWYPWGPTYSFHQEKWVQEIGMSPENFERFRLCCLLFSGVLQLLLLSANVQMYLNEAVLIWYQRLHGSKVPNLDFSRAKLFLHNYFICQVALQFFIPGCLVLLFLGLSQTRNISISLSLPGSFLFSSAFVQEGSIFMSWWIQSVWAILTCLNLALYRVGFFIVS